MAFHLKWSLWIHNIIATNTGGCTTRSLALLHALFTMTHFVGIYNSDSIFTNTSTGIVIWL